MRRPEICVCLDACGKDSLDNVVKRFLKLGIDSFEVGTTLMHMRGMGIVTELRTLLGAGCDLGVDLKTQDGCYHHLRRAREYGGDCGTVCVANNAAAFVTAPRAQREFGVGAVADLYSVPVEAMAETAARAARCGFQEIRLNCGYDAYIQSGGAVDECAGFQEVAREAGSARVSVCCYSEAGAERALRLGAAKLVLCDPLVNDRHIMAMIRKLQGGVSV